MTQLAFDYALVQFCGGSLQPLYYLIWSSFLAGSLHPCAGHFIAEHYFFSRVKTGGTDSLADLKKSKNSNLEKDQTTAQASPNPLDSLAPPETYSYYGPLNILTYNVGLHNEHHDFPAIPWTRLPELHRIASEFYEPLPSHRSWVWVIWTFILDNDVGMWCRVKRAEGGRVVGGGRGKSKKSGRGGEGNSAASVKEEEDGDGWKESEIQN
jgi:sphingolipid delta-4 desaturase